jgi:hypothetical protein
VIFVKECTRLKPCSHTLSAKTSYWSELLKRVTGVNYSSELLERVTGASNLTDVLFIYLEANSSACLHESNN